MHSSFASRNSRVTEAQACHLQWRRSSLLLAMLVVLVVIAAISPWLSKLPPMWCALADGAILVYVVMVLWQQAQRAPVELIWAGGDAPWQIVQGQHVRALRHVDLNVRGPIAVLTLADESSAKRERFVWWPDTFDAVGRRSLQLALIARAKDDRARRAPAPVGDGARA